MSKIKSLWPDDLGRPSSLIETFIEEWGTFKPYQGRGEAQVKPAQPIIDEILGELKNLNKWIKHYENERKK